MAFDFPGILRLPDPAIIKPEMVDKAQVADKRQDRVGVKLSFV